VTFFDFLESQGFQASACSALINTDFYRLAEQLWGALETIRYLDDAEAMRDVAVDALKTQIEQPE